MRPAILVIGTADTKSAEISCLVTSIKQLDCNALIMDVGVLGEPAIAVDYEKQAVANAANTTIDTIISLGDENKAMIKMAEGACNLALQLYNSGQIQAMIALGGSMGTDLALDVANSLPLGAPKLVVSTIAFSHLIPPQRLAPDLMMILWSGGLYGINSICESILKQAAGAVCGAVQALAKVPNNTNPLPRVGMTSFGKTAATWMLRLVPELKQRGFEAVVFHATGMGGRAFEAMAAKNEFVATMDFAIQEVTNHHFDSVVTAGEDRLTNAGLAGIPQLVAPGFIDLVDYPGWQGLPLALTDSQTHTHNRLIATAAINPQQRRDVMRVVANKLKTAKAEVAFLLPLKGVHEWDRAGGILCDEAGTAAVNAAAKEFIQSPVELVELDCHINDNLFVDKALEIFDRWVERGWVKSGV